MSQASRASLFSSYVRTEPPPRRHGERAYAFLDRAAGAPWEAIRTTLDSWFQHLPSEAQNEVRTRFQDADDLVHSGAFWELWVHEAFRRLGWKVTAHVGTDPGERRQDFEVERGGERFWIEATVVGGDTFVKREYAQPYGRLCDLINEVHAPEFFVSLDVLAYSSETPGRKAVVAPIQSWLAGLDPAEVRAAKGDRPTR